MSQTSQTATKPIVDTSAKILHETDCLKVRRYGSQSPYVPRTETSLECSSLTDCVLCSREITDTPEHCGVTAARLIYAGGGIDQVRTDSHRANAIRTLISCAADRLREYGWLDDRVGISVKSSSHWRSQRANTDDTARFDRLVGDALETVHNFHLLYSPPAPEADWEQTLESAASGERGMQTVKNIGKSIQWLSSSWTPQSKGIINTLLDNSSPVEKTTADPQQPPTDHSSSKSQAVSETVAQSDSQTGLSKFS